MKKLIALSISITLCLSSLALTAHAEEYYNAAAEFNQVMQYIEKGMYVEAIHDCENTLKWHVLSPDDITIFTHLKYEAEVKYKDYLYGGSTFYNPENEIAQIQHYISEGMYLEAIQDCKNTLSWHFLADTDRFTLIKLQIEAENKYNNYVNYVNLFAYYRHDGWGMIFKYYNDLKIRQYGDEHDYDQYIDIPSSGSSLTIHSYDAGVKYNWGSASTPKEAISKQVAFWKSLSADDGYGYGVGFEVLSESDTTVGSFSARQATFRASLYSNRYWTAADHILMKLIAFKYGKYIYVIEAREDAYNWSDYFWNEIEMIRTSIYFG